MPLTVFFDSVNNKTVAYIKHGVNKFEAEGQWTTDEVKMTLRLVRNFPIGSWNRAPGTLQFAIALALARTMEQARISIQEFGDNEIFRSSARGQLSVGRRVSDQPDFVSGVEIIHLDPTTAVGDTYELVFKNVAQTLAWQKQGQTSTNTVSVREGSFDIKDDTGNLFVRVRVRKDALPTEDRTESFTIQDVKTVDYLGRLARNYFGTKVTRASGEADAALQKRILDFIEDVGNTRWGLQDRLKRAVDYVPRLENTREWHEDFFVPGGLTQETVKFKPANVETSDEFKLKINKTTFSFTATAATIANVTAGLTTAINATPKKEPVTATDNGTDVEVKSDVSGQVFNYSLSTKNGGTSNDQTLTAADVSRGASPGSDVQSVAAETDSEVQHLLGDGNEGTGHIDTKISKGSPTTNFGTATTVTVGLSAGIDAHRSLFQFDLSPLPANAVIKSAALEINATAEESAASGRTMNIHRVTKIWTEAGATWNSINASLSPDIEGTMDTTTGVPGVKVSTDLTSVVQGWVDNAADPNTGVQNFGLMLKDSLEDAVNTLWTYQSREGATEPVLRVKITTFTPGSTTKDSTLIAKAKESVDTMFSGASSANYFLRTRFKKVSRQSVDFTVTAGSSSFGETFTITINDINFSYVKQAGNSAAAIASNLESKINSGDEPVTAKRTSATVAVVSDIPGQSFTFSSSVAVVTGGTGDPTGSIAENETQVNIAEINAGIDEMAPASRRVISDTGYGEEMIVFEMQDADVPSSGGATHETVGTDFVGEVLKFGNTSNPRAYFQFQVPDDYSGEGVNIVVFYRGGEPTAVHGAALFTIEERKLVDDDVWDVALVERREFKLRMPLDASGMNYFQIREEFAVLDPTWAARDIVQLSLLRKTSDARDTIDFGFIDVFGLRLYKKI